MQIIDCFLFMDELDLLEVRLHSLKDYVDSFVLVESLMTHSGNPKPLVFYENRERFKDFNIKHVIVSELKGSNAFEREFYNRDAIMLGLEGVPDDALILLSDVDEIPDLGNYLLSSATIEGYFSQRFYYYYFNTCNEAPWGGTVVVKMGNLRKESPQRYRDIRCMLPLAGYGWHFSCLGSTESIINKIEAYSHQEFNTPEHKAEIGSRRANLVDYLGRSDKRFTIEDPSGPKYLIDNKLKYDYLFYRYE